MFWKVGKILSLGLLYSLAPLLFAEAPDQLATKSNENKYPPPGQMVNVGEYKLHIYSIGSGSPSVILESGLGSISTDWDIVQKEIAKFTQVISYDRAGIAWSEPGSLPRTSKQIVEELHALLVIAKIASPYILVGHSFGGNNVQLYAATYPDEVLGIVLVDSSHEEQLKKLPSHPVFDIVMEKQNPEYVDFKSTFGVGCFMTKMYISAKLPALPEYIRNTHLALSTTTKHWLTVASESDSLAESLKQLANTDRSSIKNKPCFILTQGCVEDLSKFDIIEDLKQSIKEKQEIWQKAWIDLQRDLVSKFNRAHYLVAEKSDHSIPWNQPELIVQAVKLLIDENRQ